MTSRKMGQRQGAARRQFWQPFVMLPSVLSALLWNAASAPIAGGQQADPPPTVQESQSGATAEFEQLLQAIPQNPGADAAFDQLFDFCVRSDTIDELLSRLQTTTVAAPEDGGTWMLLGLVQLRRGEELAAANAFERAAELTPDDFGPPFHLGHARSLLGQPEKSAEALEEALRREPPQAELLNIGVTLGRLYQRQQQSEKAAQVWQRLGDAFAGDLDTLERLAEIQAEEGDHAGALARYARLVASANAPQQRARYAVRAAEMKLRMGHVREAQSELDAQLRRLDPESQLYHEIRRRLEASFTKTGDEEGLAEYYATWIDEYPGDVDALLRGGRTLVRLGRLSEARRWFVAATEHAPADLVPREALVETLLREEKFSEAAGQYEELSSRVPNDAEVFFRWGEILLADRETPAAQRRAAAAAVWERLVELRPDDAATAARAAELMCAAEQTERAIELYARAIKLAPDQLSHREALAAYLHRLGREEEALQVWASAATGPRHKSENLLRLVEVYTSFGHLERALEAMRNVCRVAPTHSNRLRFATMLREAGQYRAATEQLRVAAGQGGTFKQRDRLRAEQLRVFAAAGELRGRIAVNREAVAGPNATAPVAWVRLAWLLEANGEHREAGIAADRAVALAPTSANAWRTAARTHQRAGRDQEALDAYRRLVEIDRRNRAEYLRQIAHLGEQLGQPTTALDAGRALLELGGSDPEEEHFFAELCFRLGEVEEAFEVLHRRVQAEPADAEALTTLAQALAAESRTEEAIAWYWQALRTISDPDAERQLVAHLAGLSLRSGQWDQLIERLRSTDAEADRPWKTELMIADAYAAAGDIGQARRILDRTLLNATPDAAVLERLVEFAGQQNDAAAATGYQRILQRISPSRVGEVRLARLSFELGEVERPETIWMRISGAEDADFQLLAVADEALKNGDWQTASELCERRLAGQQDDWEVLVRLAIARRMMGEDRNATDAARRLLAIRVPRTSPSRKARRQQARSAASGQLDLTPAAASRLASTTTASSSFEFHDLLESQDVSSPRSSLRTSSGMDTQPSNFALGRMAGLAVMIGAAQDRSDPRDRSAVSAMLDSLEEKARNATLPSQAVPAWWDVDAAIELVSSAPLSGEGLIARQLRVAEQLAARCGNEGKARYIETVLRHARRQSHAGVWDAVSSTPEPLPEATLRRLVRDMWQIVAEEPRRAVVLSRPLVDQLMIAGRQEQAQRLVGRLLVHLGRSQLRFPLVAQLRDRSRFRQLSIASYDDIHDASRALAQLAEQEFQREQIEAVVSTDLDLLIDVVSRAYGRLHPMERSAISFRPSKAFVRKLAGESFTNSYETVEFPAATPVWPKQSLQALHVIWSIAKAGDLEENLLTRLRSAPADDESPTHRMARLAAAAFILHWSHSPEEAEGALAEAIAADSSCASLRVALAQLRHARGDTRGALEAVESIQARSAHLAQARGLATLQVAALLGDQPRIRQAGESLSIARLDTATQLLLAERLSELGSEELADALVWRIRQRGCNELETLAKVMKYLHARDRYTEAAADVAMQVLAASRRQTSESGEFLPEMFREELRGQAVRTLAAAGRSVPLIERLERRAVVGSVRAAAQLAELYKATGRPEQANEILSRSRDGRPRPSAPAALSDASSALGPDFSEVLLVPDQPHPESPEAADPMTPEAMVRKAQQHARSGEHAEAIESFIGALEEQPALLGRRLILRRSFQAEGYAPLVGELLDGGLDRYAENFRDLGGLTREIWERPEHRSDAQRLTLAMLEADPQMLRAAMPVVLTKDEAFTDAELFAALQDALLDKKRTGGAEGWASLDQIFSAAVGGRVGGTLTSLARLAETHRDNVVDLADRAEEAYRSEPDWYGIRALAGGLAAIVDRPQRAAELIQPLADDLNAPLNRNVAWQLGLVFGEYEALSELGIRLLEQATTADGRSGGSFQTSPLAALTAALQEAGRRSEARQWLLDAAHAPLDTPQGNPNEYMAGRRLHLLRELADELLRLEFPLEAMHLCRRTLEDHQMLSAAAQGFGASEEHLEHLRQIRATTEAELTPELCLAALETHLGPAAVEPSALTGDAKDPLALWVQPHVAGRQLAELRVETLLGTVAERAAEADGARAGLRKLAEHLASLVDAAPTSLTAAVGSAELAVRAGDEDRLGNALEALLEQLAEAEGMDSERRIGTALTAWPAVRAALDRETPHPAAQALAEQLVNFVAAAVDQRPHYALLREQNAVALRHTRTEEAKRHLQRLAAILSTPEQPPTSGGTIHRGPDGRGHHVIDAARDGAGEAEERQLKRVERGLELAELAIRQGLADISLAAVRGALNDFPPETSEPSRLEALGGYDGSVGSSSAMLSPQVEERVGQRLVQLSRAWQEHSESLSAASAYEVLREAILPAGQSKVHPYLISTPGTESLRCESGLAELARWAVRAERKPHLAERLQQSAEADEANAVIAEVGQILLALHAGPDANDTARFERISALLANRTRGLGDASLPDEFGDAEAANLVAYAAVPALESDEMGPPAAKLLRQLLPQLMFSEHLPPFHEQDTIPFSEQLGQRLVTVSLERGDVETAYATVLQLADRYKHESFGEPRQGQLLARVVPVFFRSETAIDRGMELLRRHAEVAASLPGMRAEPRLYGKLAASMTALPATSRYKHSRYFCFFSAPQEPLRLGLELLPRQSAAEPGRRSTGVEETPSQPRLVAAPFTGVFPTLLAAAEETGEIDSLVEELRAMHAAGRGNSHLALALTLDHRDHEIPAELFETIANEVTASEGQPSTASGGRGRPSHGQLAVAVTAVRGPHTAQRAAEMLEQLHQRYEKIRFSAGAAVAADAMADAAENGKP